VIRQGFGKEGRVLALKRPSTDAIRYGEEGFLARQGGDGKPSVGEGFIE